jgi:hypothetical protein
MAASINQLLASLVSFELSSFIPDVFAFGILLCFGERRTRDTNTSNTTTRYFG